MSTNSSALPPLPLPEGVKSSYVDCTSSCGLNFHVLSGGSSEGGKTPLIILMHGYPELAFSWRNIIPKLAAQGYYIVAPDQRGYGRTTGWDTRPYDEVDLRQFTITNLIRDLVCLVYALGYEKVYCIIGHDFGGVSSAMAPLIRPDMFTSCIQMSHPHHAPPAPPFNIGTSPSSTSSSTSPLTTSTLQDDLASLNPPRKHYKWYNSTSPASHDWSHPPQGLHAFLRGYFHVKSADWTLNAPHPLTSFTAPELAKMPLYYILPLHSTMPEAIASLMSTEDATLTTSWLPDADLAVYVQEWTRTGFQGGLNWYRAQTSQTAFHKADMLLFAGRKIEVPCCFISGEKDWGNYQQPESLERYGENCTDFRGVKMVQGAGHWVQQEQTGRVVEEVLEFLRVLQGEG